MHTLTYTYTRPILRRFYFRELWRTQGGWLLSLPLVLAAVFWASRNPDYCWYAGFLGGLSLAYIVLVYSSYRRLDTFPVDQTMTLTLSDTGVHFDSALVVSDVPWKAIRSSRVSKDGLILISRVTSRPVFVPSSALSDDILTFVVSKVEAARRDSKDGA